tara:strand:+ start:5031 stop:6101 length:1071 start_codon:yes stop_codon:yes gene_type:complete
MSAELELCISHLKALIACDTSNPPRNIKQSGLLNYLDSLDFISPDVIDHGEGSYNIFFKKGSPKYLINVHLDTVPAGDGWNFDPYKLTLQDDKAFGLGACDIKSSAACILSLIQIGQLNDYAVLFSTDEEAGQSTCIKKFLQTKPEHELVIVSEPTQNKAVTCHRGIFTGIKEFYGKAGHSSDKRALDDNAIHKLTLWAQKALRIAETYNKESIGPLEGLAFNIGVIEGGIKPNIIADHAQVKFGFRPLPGQSVQSLMKELELNSSKDDSKFSEGFCAPSLPANGELEPLQKIAKKLDLNLSPPVNFWTEASLFSEAGYKSIVYGPGNIDNAHQANEYVAIDELKIALKHYKNIIQ